MIALTVSLWLLLSPAACTTPLECAMERVESRGNPMAVSHAGARGQLQVMPRSGCSRLFVPPSRPTPAWRAAFCDAYANDLAPLLHIGSINRAASRAVLLRYAHRCRRAKSVVDVARCALRAYNCGGRRGISGKCGRKYVRKVEGAR